MASVFLSWKENYGLQKKPAFPVLLTKLFLLYCQSFPPHVSQSDSQSKMYLINNNNKKSSPCPSQVAQMVRVPSYAKVVNLISVQGTYNNQPMIA